jgi:hypothetical protein
MTGVIQFFVDNQVVILGVLFFLSEALSLIPQVGSNGVFQLIFSGIKALYGKFKPAELPPAA